MEAAARIGEMLSDDQLAELIAMLPEAGDIELKVTVPRVDQSATLPALGLDPVDAQIQQVYFFDTPDLALNSAGVTARARRVQGRRDDTIVKLGPLAPWTVPATIRDTPGVTLEVEATAGGYLCSAAFKARLSKPRVRSAVAGHRAVRTVFSKPQRTLLAEFSPGEAEAGDLAAMGPIFVLKLRFARATIVGKMFAELWLYPDGSQILEVARRCAPDRALEAAAETREFLSGCDVEFGRPQGARTRAALEHFARGGQIPA